MLFKDSVLASAPLAEELTKEGLSLTVRPNTLLASLVNATYQAKVNTVSPIQPDGDVVAMEIGNMLERLTNGTVDHQTAHDMAMTEVVDLLKQSILRHVSFARNVVIPVVKEYAENLIQHMEAGREETAASQFNIRQLKVPEFIQDLGFLDKVKVYKDAIPVDPDKGILGLKTADEIVKVLMTGDQSLDQDIVAWYSRKGPQFLDSIWQNFFMDGSQVPEGAERVFVDTIQAMNVFDKLDYAIGIYLLGDHLYDRVDENVTGVDLSGYKTIMAHARDFGGAVAVNALSTIDLYRRTRMMVVEINAAKKTVGVFDEIYVNWLKNGGTPDTVLGLLVSDQVYRTEVAINSNKDRLDDAWNSYCLFYNSSAKNREFNYFRDLALTDFNETLKHFSDEENAFIKRNPGYLQKVADLVRDEVAQLTQADMENVHAVAQRIVCRCRFYYTDAEQILEDIVSASSVRKNVDQREAATVATMKLMVRFMVDQMVKTTA